MFDLKLENVSKRYLVRQESPSGAASQNALVRKLRALRGVRQEFWAVRDVSFEVERGEALGIIGHNGAGKSTLLKLLSNITTPTYGKMTINGRLSALIEVGSGFHPELTGRENIFLCGSILGMRRREIAEKLDSIVDFADVRRFIDTPVKRYSSGMYVRLGFSIAAHLDPDILLLDEVLAVGDAAFQSKCLTRIAEMKKSGVTIIFISHDLTAVEQLCNRVILMKRGQVAADGAPHEVIAEYARQASSSFAPTIQRENAAHARPDHLGRRARITGVSFRNEYGDETLTFRTGERVVARLEYEANELVPAASLDMIFHAPDGEPLCQLTTAVRDESFDIKPGAGAIEFVCPELALQPGLYYLDASIRQRGASEEIDFQHRCANVCVNAGKHVNGEFYLPHTWRAADSCAANAGREAN